MIVFFSFFVSIDIRYVSNIGVHLISSVSVTIPTIRKPSGPASVQGW